MRTHAHRGSAWWGIGILYLPVVLYYATHYAAAITHPGLKPTGFIQYDLPYSMACAREFNDVGSHGLLFPLPSLPTAHNTPILLQLHVWALGQVWRVTHIDPGLLYVLFGALFGLFAVRAFVRVFDLFIPSNGAARMWGQIIFLWGGGLFVVAGEALNIWHARPIADTWKHLLDLDPAHGWWMLSLGRCLLLPNEAYYHFLFFSALLAVVRKRFALAVLLLIVLAASHPFAGMGGLLVFLVWSSAELGITRERTAPLFFPIVLLLTMATCMYYYFGWLPSRMDPQLASALGDRFTLRWFSMIPAYLLVAIMAAMRLRAQARFTSFCSSPAHRFLLILMIVQVALENHDLFLPAHQPLHFTRGYQWAALFLIGAPWLMDEAWPAVKVRWNSASRVIAVLVIGLFVLDNAAFFTLNMKRQLRASSPGFWLTPDQQSVLAELNEHFDPRSLLIAQEPDLAYMATVYTPWRAYRSHFFNSNDAWSRVREQEAYFRGSIIDPLLNPPLTVVANRAAGDFVPPGRSELIYENMTYRVFQMR